MIIGTTVQPIDAKKKKKKEKNPTARPMVSGCMLSRTTAIIVGNTGPQGRQARRIVAEVAARPLTNASASISTTQADELLLLFLPGGFATSVVQRSPEHCLYHA